MRIPDAGAPEEVERRRRTLLRGGLFLAVDNSVSAGRILSLAPPVGGITRGHGLALANVASRSGQRTAEPTACLHALTALENGGACGVRGAATAP